MCVGAQGGGAGPGLGAGRGPGCARAGGHPCSLGPPAPPEQGGGSGRAVQPRAAAPLPWQASHVVHALLQVHQVPQAEQDHVLHRPKPAGPGGTCTLERARARASPPAGRSACGGREPQPRAQPRAPTAVHIAPVVGAGPAPRPKGGDAHVAHACARVAGAARGEARLRTNSLPAACPRPPMQQPQEPTTAPRSSSRTDHKGELVPQHDALGVNQRRRPPHKLLFLLLLRHRLARL